MSEPARTETIPAQSAPAVKAYRREIGGKPYRWRLRLSTATTVLFLASMAALSHWHGPVWIVLAVTMAILHIAAVWYLCKFWSRRPLRNPQNVPEHLQPLVETLGLPEDRWYFLDHKGADIWMLSSLVSGAWFRLHCHFIWVEGKGPVSAKEELVDLLLEKS